MTFKKLFFQVLTSLIAVATWELLGFLLNKAIEYSNMEHAGITNFWFILFFISVNLLFFLISFNNKKQIINIKTSAYDEAYKHFANQLSYAIGRYKGYSSNLAPDKGKYTEVGVMERINEVKSARLQLLSVCGKNVRAILLGAGTEWLDDIHSFGKTAPSIMEKLSKTEFKDRI